MKHSIEIHEICNVTKYGVEYITKVIDKNDDKVISSCQTSFESSKEMFAAVESGNVINEDNIYKSFAVESEEDLREKILNIAYDACIEKKLLEFDIDDDF